MIFSSWWTIKALTANQNTSCFNKLKHLKCSHRTAACFYINRTLSCVDVDANIVSIIGVNDKKHFELLLCICNFAKLTTQLLHLVCKSRISACQIIVHWKKKRKEKTCQKCRDFYYVRWPVQKKINLCIFSDKFKIWSLKNPYWSTNIQSIYRKYEYVWNLR